MSDTPKTPPFLKQNLIIPVPPPQNTSKSHNLPDQGLLNHLCTIVLKFLCCLEEEDAERYYRRVDYGSDNAPGDSVHSTARILYILPTSHAREQFDKHRHSMQQQLQDNGTTNSSTHDQFKRLPHNWANLVKCVDWDEFVLIMTEAMAHQANINHPQHPLHSIQHFLFDADIFRVQVLGGTQSGAHAESYLTWLMIIERITEWKRHRMALYRLDETRGAALWKHICKVRSEHAKTPIPIEFTQREKVFFLEFIFNGFNTEQMDYLLDECDSLWNFLPSAVSSTEPLSSETSLSAETIHKLVSDSKKTIISTTFEILSAIDKNPPKFLEEKQLRPPFTMKLTRRSTDQEQNYIIESEPCDNKKLAKASACLLMLQALHKNGDIDDQLKPVITSSASKKHVQTSDAAVHKTAEDPNVPRANYQNQKDPVTFFTALCQTNNIKLSSWYYPQDGEYPPYLYGASVTFTLPKSKAQNSESVTQTVDVDPTYKSKKLAKSEVCKLALSRMHELGIINDSGEENSGSEAICIPRSLPKSLTTNRIQTDRIQELSLFIITPEAGVDSIGQYAHTMAILTKLKLSSIRVELPQLVPTAHLSFQYEDSICLLPEQMKSLISWFTQINQCVNGSTKKPIDSSMDQPVILMAPLKNENEVDWEFVSSGVKWSKGDTPPNRMICYQLKSDQNQEKVNNLSYMTSREQQFNLSPNDPFPFKEEYSSYHDYFLKKHGIDIAREQPMVAVQPRKFAGDHAKPIHIPNQFVQYSNVSRYIFELWIIFPKIQSSIMEYFLFEELKEQMKKYSIESRLLKQALTFPERDSRLEFNYESLEFFGDGVLKLLSTNCLFFSNLSEKEGSLTSKKMSIISNQSLYDKVKSRHLQNYFILGEEVGSHAEYMFFMKRYDIRLKYKKIADVMEALIGAVASSPPSNTRLNRTWYFLKDWNILPCSPKQIMAKNYLSTYKTMLNDYEDAHRNKMSSANFQQFKNLVSSSFGHEFLRPVLLLQAQTHGSERQRLELLGDCLMDALVESYLHRESAYIEPRWLTVCKHMAVSNDAFSAVLIDTGLHKYANYSNMGVVKDFQKRRQSQLRNKYDLVRGAPKQLGDFFESIIGCVWVDLVLSNAAGLESIDALMERFSSIVLSVCQPYIERHADPKNNFLGVLHEAIAKLNADSADTQKHYRLDTHFFKGNEIIIHAGTDASQKKTQYEVAKEAVEYLQDKKLFVHEFFDKSASNNGNGKTKASKNRKRKRKKSATDSQKAPQSKKQKLSEEDKQDGSSSVQEVSAVSGAEDVISEYTNFLSKLMKDNNVIGIELNEVGTKFRLAFGLSPDNDWLLKLLKERIGVQQVNDRLFPFCEKDGPSEAV